MTKFRGKTKEKGEWIFGDLITFEDGSKAIIPHSNKLSQPGKIGVEGIRIITVVPETVGQFVGKTDNNGNELYKDDIIVTEDYLGHKEELGLVIYDPPNFKLNRRIAGQDPSRLRYIEHPAEYFRNCYKQGNKFDNPKLLEGDN